MFQENNFAVCFQWHFLLYGPVSCIYPLSGTAKLSRVSSPTWCSAACGLRAGTPGDCLQHSAPSPVSTNIILDAEERRPCPLLPSAALCSCSRWSSSVCSEALASPRANPEPSLEEDPSYLGVKVGQRKCQWAGEGMSKTAAFLWLRLLECLTRRSFLEEPHLTLVTFFPTFVIYVFIRSFEYWYLLLKGSMWCFAVELVFGFLQIPWVIDLPLGSLLTSIHYNILWTHNFVT